MGVPSSIVKNGFSSTNHPFLGTSFQETTRYDLMKPGPAWLKRPCVRVRSAWDGVPLPWVSLGRKEVKANAEEGEVGEFTWNFG